MTQGYWPGEAVEYVASDKEVASEPRTVPRCFSLYRTGRTVITLYTPHVPHGPRGSSVQVDSIIAACASA